MRNPATDESLGRQQEPRHRGPRWLPKSQERSEAGLCPQRHPACLTSFRPLLQRRPLPQSRLSEIQAKEGDIGKPVANGKVTSPDS